MQCRCEKHMYVYTTFTISKNQLIVHVYILGKTLGRPGKKNVHMSAPSLPLGRIDKDGSGQLTLEELIQGNTPAWIYGEKQWQHKKICVCVYVLYLFWWKNVQDSVCVCSWLMWEMWLYNIYIYYPIFTACSVGNRGTMELRGFWNGIVHNWSAAEVLSRLECIVTLAYLLHNICINCDHLSAIHAICVRLKCLQLDKLSVPSRKESFSNLFLWGGLMVAKCLC